MVLAQTDDAPPPAPFEQIYLRWSVPIFRYCLAQVRNTSVAEDLASETFQRAYAAYQRSGTEPDSVQAWLFRIAHNVVIDHGRRSRRWLRFLSEPRHADPETPDVAKESEVREEIRRAFAALNRISADDRRIIGLRIGAELSFGEIGGILGITEGSAGVRCRRAIERWKAQTAKEDA